MKTSKSGKIQIVMKGYQLYTDEEIILQVMRSEPSNKEDDADEEEDRSLFISSYQAANMLDKCLTLYKHQLEATPTS